MNPRALIVEDDFTQRFGLKMAISKEGYDIIEAEDGKSALRIIQSNAKFDLVILDYNLGDIKGTTLAKELKKNNSAKKIVLVSSQVDEFIGNIDSDIEVFAKPIKESDVQKITAIGYNKEDIKNLKIEIENKGISESFNIKSINNFGKSTGIAALLEEIKRNNDHDLILFDKAQISNDLVYNILLKQQEIQKDIQYIMSELKKIDEQKIFDRLTKIETHYALNTEHKERNLNIFNITVAAVGVIVSILIAIFASR